MYLDDFLICTYFLNWRLLFFFFLQYFNCWCNSHSPFAVITVMLRNFSDSHMPEFLCCCGQCWVWVSHRRGRRHPPHSLASCHLRSHLTGGWHGQIFPFRIAVPKHCPGALCFCWPPACTRVARGKEEGNTESLNRLSLMIAPFSPPSHPARLGHTYKNVRTLVAPLTLGTHGRIVAFLKKGIRYLEVHGVKKLNLCLLPQGAMPKNKNKKVVWKACLFLASSRESSAFTRGPAWRGSSSFFPRERKH